MLYCRCREQEVKKRLWKRENKMWKRKKNGLRRVSLYLLFNSRGVKRISRKCHRKEIIFGQVASSRTNERRWIRRRGRQTHTARTHSLIHPPKHTHTLFLVLLFYFPFYFQRVDPTHHWLWRVANVRVNVSDKWHSFFFSAAPTSTWNGGWWLAGAWTSNVRDALAHVKRKSKMGNSLHALLALAYPFAENSEPTDDVWNKIQHDWTCLPFACALF